MKAIRNFLEKMGIPSQDLYNLPTSKKVFLDGAQYRIECVLGGRHISEVEQMMAFLDGAEDHNLTINRITETQGIMLHTDKELEQMIELARKAKVELFLSPGTRADLLGQKKRFGSTGAFEGGADSAGPYKHFAVRRRI